MRNYKRFTEPLRADPYAGRVQNACLGIPAERIASICQVDVATARRWKSGRSRIPFAAQALLEGDLGAFSKHWQGWRIIDETIYSPDQWAINRNHALSVQLMEAQIKQRDATIASLMDQIDYLKSVHALQDQPAPSAMPEIKNAG